MEENEFNIMYEPTIVVPSSRFVKKCDWALEATAGNQPAAEMLVSVFLYHYDNRLANKMLIELVARTLLDKEYGLHGIGDWLPYSHNYLRELLFYTHGRTQIIKGLQVLEELKFISTDVPEDIKRFYAVKNTWVKVEIPNIKSWLNKTYLPNRRALNAPATQWEDIRLTIEKITSEEKKIDGGFSYLPDAEDDGDDDKEKEKEKEKEKKYEAAKSIGEVEQYSGAKPARVMTNLNNFQKREQNIKIICAFHKHITGRNDSYIYDKERVNFIRARLKEGRTLIQCVRVILGNLHSDFHQGRSPKNIVGQRDEHGRIGAVLDDVRNIFGTAQKFERFLVEADKADIFDFRAKKEIEGFLQGIPSKYAKQQVKGSLKPKNEQPSIDKLDLSERRIYMSFAGSIGSYFKTLSASDVLELAQSNQSLLKRAKGIDNADLLFQSLAECYQAFDSLLSESVKAEMRKFADKFAEFLKYN